MPFIVSADDKRKINLAPDTETEEVLQNVWVIISTPKFSVPLDRGLGLSQRFVDKPLPVAETMIVSEVLDAIEEYEPRAEIGAITFKENDTPGKLIPQVEVVKIGNRESA